MHVAILEDDDSQGELLSYWLKLGHFHPHLFARGLDLIQAMQQTSFDALILDWNVPDLSGLDVLTRVRREMNSNIPVLFSTARESEEDIVKALRQGADDYVVKPLRRNELLARLGAITTRTQQAAPASKVLEVGCIRLDSQARRLLLDDTLLTLTSKDFDLATLFLTNIGRFLSRQHILDAVWGKAAPIGSRTVDTHVSRVRNKLELTAEHGWNLGAIYGHGYRLERLRGGARSELDHADAPSR